MPLPSWPTILSHTSACAPVTRIAQTPIFTPVPVPTSSFPAAAVSAAWKVVLSVEYCKFILEPAKPEIAWLTMILYLDAGVKSNLILLAVDPSNSVTAAGMFDHIVAEVIKSHSTVVVVEFIDTPVPLYPENPE